MIYWLLTLHTFTGCYPEAIVLVADQSATQLLSGAFNRLIHDRYQFKMVNLSVETYLKITISNEEEYNKLP